MSLDADDRKFIQNILDEKYKKLDEELSKKLSNLEHQLSFQREYLSLIDAKTNMGINYFTGPQPRAAYVPSGKAAREEESLFIKRGLYER